tara:strand:- start:82 stop:1122 length:1041 start_codon:yes stop_codon:yes gene_type:complete
MADMFEEGIKAAGKAEYIGALPDSTFMGGATIRDKMRGALRNLGMDNRGINALIGDMRDEDLIDNIGILDLTPAMLPAVIQEGSRSIKQGDYLQGGLDLGFSAIEMAPFAALVSKPLKGFLRNLGTKSMAKETPIDPSRRNFLTKAGTTAVAAPLAVGALSEVPVGKIIDDVLPTTKIVEDAVIEPKIVGSNLFKNIKQEAKFAADMYNVKTGKNLSPNEIIKRDMAEYLYFAEEGDFNPGMLEKATRNLKSNPVYEVLDDIGYEPEPDELEILKKHMGDADGYEYGSSGGDELTQRFFEEENPDKLFKDEMGNLTYNNDDIIDWVKSKGIQKTKYYKDLVKAGNK